LNTIDADAESLFYLDPYPDNHPVVFLLHGLGTEASSWTYQLDALGKAGYRPIAPDLPGFGRSKFHGDRWSIRYAAGVVLALADRLQIEQFHMAGISMGGTIALQTSIDYPHRITSLELINTFATLRPKRWNEWIYLLKRYFRARVRGVGAQAELTAKRIFPGPEQEDLRLELVTHIRQTDPLVYKQAMRELGFYDVRKRLQEIRIPTLVITGMNDTTVPLENQHDLACGIPGCLQVFIANAGHGVIIDQPAEVNRTMVEFLIQHSI
jgi:3-oxoadipate enol-lactonase